MYILGNAPGVAKQAAANLNRKYPELQIKGARSGFFHGNEENEIVSEIRRLRPHVLWVGMGNPLQELWVEKHFDDLRVPIALTCGGMMDIVSGRLARPPHWITDNGFEWAYRLVTKPKYNWRRYVIGNVSFLIKLALHRRCATANV
jgi:N-acetylglucosaminyldiphosphoundecaprenol N-acetyl-beta-D-mannosaminyltransferase